MSKLSYTITAVTAVVGAYFALQYFSEDSQACGTTITMISEGLKYTYQNASEAVAISEYLSKSYSLIDVDNSCIKVNETLGYSTCMQTLKFFVNSLIEMGKNLQITDMVNLELDSTMEMACKSEKFHHHVTNYLL